MTDLAVAEPAPSTVVDVETPPDASGAGVPRTLDPEAKEPAKESLRDTISKVVKEEPKGEKEEKAPEKADKEAKPQEAKEPAKGPERAPDGKFAAKQPEDEEKSEGDAEAKQPEAKSEPEAKPNGQHIEAPAKFLPDAKEKWVNTPRAVQRDVADTIQRYEREAEQFREVAQRYEPIRQYDEYVRQNGRAGVHETLAEVAQLEELISKNPVAGLNQILLRAGPRKPDGQPFSLFELAQHIVNSGQDNYHKAVAQPQPQQRGPDPEVEQLKQQLAKMQEQTLAATVIEPFKAAHPRYTELQDDIALFLQSGKIPTSLSPSERLAAAYDMAVRINPASHGEGPADETDPEPGRADDDLSGSKSIKSAPGAVSPDMEPERGGSIRDLLASELKRAKRS